MKQADKLKYTLLRNGFYSELQLPYLRQALTTNTLATPLDGPVAYVSRTDLAEAAAVVMCGSDYENSTLTLTGTEALDHQTLAARLTELSGQVVARRVVDDTSYHAGLLEQGVLPQFADWTLGMFKAARQNRYATVYNDLSKILGHNPQSIDRLLASIAVTG